MLSHILFFVVVPLVLLKIWVEYVHAADEKQKELVEKIRKAVSEDLNEVKKVILEELRLKD